MSQLVNHFSLSQLLPYDTASKKNRDLRTGLQEYGMLLEALKYALIDFQNNDLEKFDALVGENACQIRAIWIAQMAENQTINSDKLNQQIQKAQDGLSALLSREISKLMLGGTTLENVLSRDGLEICLTKDEMFLLQIYLLTVAREEQTNLLRMRRVADPKKLKRFGDVSTNFTQNLLHILRKNVSMQSVEFIREKAVELQSKSCVRMSSEEFTIRHNSTFCIPMFWTYRVVLSAAKKAKIPLILHVKFVADPEMPTNDVEEEYLLFKCEDGYSYTERPFTMKDLDQAAFVVEGISVCNNDRLSKGQWKTSIKEFYIENIILAGAADHRQYPEVSEDRIVEQMNDELYNNYKEMALNEGFALLNPTKFFIQYVYAAQIARLPQVMNNVLAGEAMAI